MFRIIGRIIRWIGPRKSKIYWGFVFSFIQALFTAMPVMAAAYAINLVLEQTKGGPTRSNRSDDTDISDYGIYYFIHFRPVLVFIPQGPLFEWGRL